MLRQKYFYHASPACDLQIIEPRRITRPTGFEEGEVVATDNFAFSTMFLVPHDDSWANGGAFNNIPYFVIGDRTRFTQSDNGGCIYLVYSKTFQNYNKREWFSKNKLIVLGRVKFSSGLMAMLIVGVQVYFTDKNTYKKIRRSHDHGLSILNDMVSENESLGYPAKQLEMYFGSKRLSQNNHS